ncbi:pilus assembly protein [Sagittula sp. NFXS13]|uniref:TadE/TadG family type IV pilus assembly protein n=1 Tax=Sagittula sp. NFXS13 TaxID=2819095 RepID=UPI0032DFB18F
MMSRIQGFATRFCNDEEGASASIEFIFYFLAFFVILMTAFEISAINIRHAMLERAVDMSVRDIRLSTGDVPSYSDLRRQICEDAGVIESCSDNLRLEMVQVDPRDFWTISDIPDCKNAEQPPRPLRNFVEGQDNALMLVRACLKYKPIFPTTAVGAGLDQDAQGYAKLIVNSAFVQEPR